jgi:alkanesulfonate monooxygenase SsuD/methylene tetrahydromethanopterin reductase-like flavin-dependent oxidoreductase (luciferase family)
MLAYHFTEMPYPYFPPEAETEYGTPRVLLPNRFFDSAKGADLYNRYLDDYVYADEIGLEIMLNEHHQTATCTDVAVSLSAAVLARQTKRAKICILGTPLPHRDSPVRVAEEIAMLDCISRGRIISGFVRGVGTEVHPANTNPVLTRERMEESHDLIVKAWTTPEPFNWEGKHWHYRYVNVWPQPYQKPHPSIWITGTSPDNVPWVADHQYTFAAFLMAYDDVTRLYDIYRRRSEELGFRAPGNEKFAYLALCYVADTDEKALDEGKELMWYLGRRRHPALTNPPGFNSVRTNMMIMKGVDKPRGDTFDSLRSKGIVIAGSPTTVLEQCKEWHRRGVGHLLMMNQAGALDTEKTRRSMKLFADEVYPELKALDPHMVDGAAPGMPAEPEPAVAERVMRAEG